MTLVTPADPMGPDDDRYQQMVASIGAAAQAVEQGSIVKGQQLDELRRVIRRLRRGVEIYAICASVPCEGCGDLFVPLASAPVFCSDTCRTNDRGPVKADPIERDF